MKNLTMGTLMFILLATQSVSAQKMEVFYLGELGVRPLEENILLSSTVSSKTTGFSVVAPSAVKGVLTQLSVAVDGLLGEGKIGSTLPQLSLQHVPLIIPGYLQTSWGASTRALNSVSLNADAMFTGLRGYFIGVGINNEFYYEEDSVMVGRGDIKRSTHLFSYIAGHFPEKRLLVNVRLVSDFINRTKWVIDLEESEFRIEHKIEGSSLYLGLGVSGSGSERKIVFAYSM